MSIFGSIMGATFGSKAAPGSSATSTQTTVAQSSSGTPQPSSAGAASSGQSVDVEAVLNERASYTPQGRLPSEAEFQRS